MIKDKRLHTFDFLRGFFIVLALMEHYTYYFNFLFLKYYTDQWYVINQYQLSRWTDPLAMDWVLQTFGIVFISWVSQVYLALASLNLTMTLKKDPLIFKRKMKSYLFLFFLFTVEKVIVSSNLGEFLSLDPIQNWMLVLSGISLSLYYLGRTATFSIGFILGISVFIPALNDPFIELERYIQLTFPDFSLESRPQIFVISALIGAWFGEKINTNFLTERKDLLLFPSLAITAFISYQFAPRNIVSKVNVLYHEYDWSFSAFGSLYIWSIISFVIVSAIFLEKKHLSIKVPIINFIGRKSLWYFVFHRIFFLLIYIPLRIATANIFNLPIQNNILEVGIAISLFTLIFYFGNTITRRISNQAQN